MFLSLTLTQLFPSAKYALNRSAQGDSLGIESGGTIEANGEMHFW